MSEISVSNIKGANNYAVIAKNCLNKQMINGQGKTKDPAPFIIVNKASGNLEWVRGINRI